MLIDEYREEVIVCLIVYGKLDDTQARLLVSESGYFESGIPDTDILFHEPPYYWAMHLFYGKKSRWYLDPTLWPPPEDYNFKFSGREQGIIHKKPNSK